MIEKSERKVKNPNSVLLMSSMFKLRFPLGLFLQIESSQEQPPIMLLQLRLYVNNMA
jgi:hypothetical protein